MLNTISKKNNLMNLVNFFLFFIITLTGSCTSWNIKKQYTSVENFMNNIPIQELQNHPEKILVFFEQYKKHVKPLFPNINIEGRKAIFSALITYQIKPYGSSKTPEASLSQLINARKISCAQQTHLTYHFYHLLSPTCKKDCAKFYFVGWDWIGKGDHAQIFLDNTGDPLLLDATLGLAVQTSFDEIAQGQAIPESRIKDFFRLNQQPILFKFHDFIINLIREGKYKPSNLLYFYRNFSDCIKNYDKKIIDTPAGSRHT